MTALSFEWRFRFDASVASSLDLDPLMSPSLTAVENRGAASCSFCSSPWRSSLDRVDHIAYRPGGHAHSLPDWLALLDFADHQLFAKPIARRFDQLPYPDRAAACFTWTAPR